MALQKERIADLKWCKTSPRAKRKYKKDMHKLRRNQERKDVENAMKKNRYKGWST